MYINRIQLDVLNVYEEGKENDFVWLKIVYKYYLQIFKEIIFVFYKIFFINVERMYQKEKEI